MKNKKIKPNEATKWRLQGRTLPDELANLFLRTAEHRYSNLNFDINETLKFLNAYVKLLQKYIKERSIKNALVVQCLLDHAYYNFGLGKPLYLRWAARRGGQAKKIKKGIWTAMEKYLSQKRISTPRRMWNFFKTWNYSNDQPYSTPDLNYEVWFERDIIHDGPTGGLLFQRSLDGKESSITFKTFERYFYEIRNKVTPIQA